MGSRGEIQAAPAQAPHLGKSRGVQALPGGPGPASLRSLASSRARGRPPEAVLSQPPPGSARPPGPSGRWRGAGGGGRWSGQIREERGTQVLHGSRAQLGRPRLQSPEQVSPPPVPGAGAPDLGACIPASLLGQPLPLRPGVKAPPPERGEGEEVRPRAAKGMGSERVSGTEPSPVAAPHFLQTTGWGGVGVGFLGSSPAGGGGGARPPRPGGLPAPSGSVKRR